MASMEWVPEFYRKQYEWADWRNRWADFDPAASDPHVDAVRRLAVEGPKRILELGAGTGSTAAALAHAGHDVVTIELQPMLAEHISELASDVEGGSLKSRATRWIREDRSTSSHTSTGSASGTKRISDASLTVSVDG